MWARKPSTAHRYALLRIRLWESAQSDSIPASTMFLVSRSITGQYVVQHPATNTVIVGDDLTATFERMRALTDGQPGGEATGGAGNGPTEPAGRAEPRRARPRIAPWLALALLPFLWLGALHVSLGRLVSELRAAAPASGESTATSELRARVERLERQLEERPGGVRSHAKPTSPRPADREAKPEHDGDAEAGATDAEAGD